MDEVRKLRHVRPKSKSRHRRDDDDSQGLVYMWEGCKPPSPRSFDIFKGIPIQKVAVGAKHCLFLSTEGVVYAFGNNQHGQLGLDTFRDCMDRPKLVADLTERVMDVSCGAKHSAAVTCSGQVFCWGDSTEGQCGLGQLLKFPSPSRVEIIQTVAAPCKHTTTTPVCITQIDCGSRHTVGISEEGEVWTWGSGPQLGLSSVDKAPVPMKVEFLIGRKVLSICCGQSHTVALVRKDKLSANGVPSQKPVTPDLISTKRRLLSGNKSRSQSPVINGVQQHRSRPATCVKCENEIYSYAVSEDSVVINDKHKCPLGLEVDKKEGETAAENETYQASATNEPSASVSEIELKELQNPSTCESSDVTKESSSDATASTEEGPSQVSSHSETEISSTSKDPNEDENISHSQENTTQASGREKLLRRRSPNVTASELHIDTTLGQGQDNLDSEHVPRSQSFSPRSGLRKSRSAFLDETEAIEFLHKQLLGDEEKPLSVSRQNSSSSPPTSPFVKKIQENFRSYMATAPAMQEYVSNLTKSVVSNIKTSVDKYVFPPTVEELDEQTLLRMRMGSVEEEEYHLAWREFDRHGSIPRSTSMGLSQMGKSQHARKASLPGGLIDDTHRTFASFVRHEICLDTEVWSWGQGGKGQLGHGDTLDRSQPCRIKMFADKKVVKVACGSYHSLALTAASQLYAWGDNGHLQLGHEDPPSSASPKKTQTPVNSSIWDVAAGDNHSLFVSDGATFCPEVYYCGKNPGASQEEAKTLCHRVAVLRKIGWVQTVVAGGDSCVCIADKNASGNVSVLHEFASTERHFHRQLQKISSLLTAFVHSEWFKNTETTELETSIQMLVVAFGQLADMVAVNHLEWKDVIKGFTSLHGVQLIAKPDHCTSQFQHYSKCFSDMLSMGGFDLCTRKFSAFFDKVQSKLADMLEPRRVDNDSVAMTFKRVLQTPFLRLKEYNRLISKVALRYPAYTSEHAELSKIAQEWDTLKQSATSDHSEAEKTKTFWETCTLKLADSLRSPTRRLLKESKQNPLTLPSAGMFATHTFLLFSDVFVHVQYSNHQTYQLSTVWVESVQSSESLKNGIVITTPEDTLTLSAPTASDKAEWLWGLNQAIDKLLNQQKNMPRPAVTTGSLYPPRDRQANHVFTKIPALKNAKYAGMWRDGKLHGHGELVWPDGGKYVGSFLEGQQEGYGDYTVEKEEGHVETYKGQWKAGKMHGIGYIRYANGDIFEGHFKEGKRHGHGIFKQGKLTSPVASIYIGEWANDKKNGYGVHDDIVKGEKYMGQWQDGNKHGRGIIVTLDGMYFEGTFTNNRITGRGLLITEDNSYYEGEFAGGPNLYGKGVLTLPNGDYIEGSFNGSFQEGIKINGTFRKAKEPFPDMRGSISTPILEPKSFGQLCIPPDMKWTVIFQHCYTVLGCEDLDNINSSKAWERIASLVTHAGKSRASVERQCDSKAAGAQSSLPEILEKIPTYNCPNLTTEIYANIREYLAKAFNTRIHPLGTMMDCVVDVYRATYVGVDTHPRLLRHAVDELKSIIRRIYQVVRVLFPVLCQTGEAVEIFPEGYDEESVSQTDSDNDPVEVISAASLLHPLFLPKIYPPLFTLYALYKEKEDEKYWKRVTHWNKQSDVALMSYLGMNEKFWLVEQAEEASLTVKLSSLKDRSYTEAIETLQHVSTSFSPAEKLQLIQKTFHCITKVVHAKIGTNHLWSMDELFPVFLYVVVRARIQHLGAEIHFIEDLMEVHLEHGELGIMFTTLHGCYCQIHQERLT